MSFDNRREYLFLYTVKDANPNGNPLEENHPRYDEDTQQALVSDVRVKRTIRDEWVRRGLNVFVDGEPKTLKARFDELKKITGKESAKDIMKKCIDTRLFGVTFALGKEAFSWTGPVQFKWGRSLHAATFEFIQGTSAFATEGREGAEKQQRSFRNEYKVPFALIGVYGIANQFASKFSGATEEDLSSMFEALWDGTDNLIKRKKNEHKSRFAMEVKYSNDFYGKIGSLDEKIKIISIEGKELAFDEQKAIRSLEDIKVDIKPLVQALNNMGEYIDSIKVVVDREIQLEGKEELEAISSVAIETR